MVWMVRPAPIQGVPPGLEYLSQINNLKVRQVVNLLESNPDSFITLDSLVLID